MEARRSLIQVTVVAGSVGLLVKHSDELGWLQVTTFLGNCYLD
jgi:hypothetical protein